MTNLLLLLLLHLLLIPLSRSMEYGLQWGEECKIPGPKEFLKHTEECEMSKGLHCQVYQQGSFCGCLIRSSLSYDINGGECRRKPGHHCPFINTTDPSTTTRIYGQHKCHVNAECKIVDPIPEDTKNKKQQFAVCRCKPGYKESKDGLICHNINSSPPKHQPNKILFPILLLTTLLLTT